jgi:hypothetical protein
MTLRRTLATVLIALGFELVAATRGFCEPVEQSVSLADFGQRLQQIGSLSADPCNPPDGQQSADVAPHLFSDAENVIADRLNSASVGPLSPQNRAVAALKELEQMSAEVNGGWPGESRFHFQVLDLSPALVVTMSIRAEQEFVVFAVPEEDLGKPNRLWRNVGSEHESGPENSLDLHPLHRSASGNARFLARFHPSGCAGSVGVVYDAREWNPRGSGSLEGIIKQVGSFGLDDRVPGFEQIGVLRTDGPFVTLPFCWFSAIDTGDNPSLCAVDTYDLSGDHVRFRSRTYNRPDLLPVAKAIEYAKERDYRSVLSYCASAEVAHGLVRNMAPEFVGDDLRVTRRGHLKKRVEVGFEPRYRFDVEKRAGTWLLVAFIEK